MPFTLFISAIEKTVNFKKNTLLIRKKLLIDKSALGSYCATFTTGTLELLCDGYFLFLLQLALLFIRYSCSLTMFL